MGLPRKYGWLATLVTPVCCCKRQQVLLQAKCLCWRLTNSKHWRELLTATDYTKHEWHGAYSLFRACKHRQWQDAAVLTAVAWKLMDLETPDNNNKAVSMTQAQEPLTVDTRQTTQAQHHRLVYTRFAEQMKFTVILQYWHCWKAKMYGSVISSMIVCGLRKNEVHSVTYVQCTKLS